jgi:hypothetical protein
MKKTKEGLKLEAKLKDGIRILEANPSRSVRSAAGEVNICNKLLKRHYSQYLSSGLSLRDWKPDSHSGRPKILNEDQIRILNLYLNALD